MYFWPSGLLVPCQTTEVHQHSAAVLELRILKAFLSPILGQGAAKKVHPDFFFLSDKGNIYIYFFLQNSREILSFCLYHLMTHLSWGHLLPGAPPAWASGTALTPGHQDSPSATLTCSSSATTCPWQGCGHWRSPPLVRLPLSLLLPPFITFPESEYFLGKRLSPGTLSPCCPQGDPWYAGTLQLFCFVIQKTSVVQQMHGSVSKRGYEERQKGPEDTFSFTAHLWDFFFKYSRHSLAAVKQLDMVNTERKACTVWIINFQGKGKG